MRTDDEQPAGNTRLASSTSSKGTWGEFLRVLRLSARGDIGQRRRALAKEAEADPAGLAGWALASDLWTRGDIAAAYRLADKALRTKPTDFRLPLICLTYYIRARDSAQIYAFAERLIAAKNPACQLRLIHAAESLFLWPLWLLGSRFGCNVKRHADNLDRWVAWAKNYLASHPRPIVSGGDPVGGEQPPAEVPAREIEEVQVRKRAPLVVAFVFLIIVSFLIALFLYGALLFARKSSRTSQAAQQAYAQSSHRRPSRESPRHVMTALVDAALGL